MTRLQMGCLKRISILDTLIISFVMPVYKHIAPLAEFPAIEMQKVVQVNLNGCLLLAKHALQQFKTAKHSGSITLMGSIHSSFVSKNKAPYVAAKHGLHGLLKSLAVEGQPLNIAAYMVEPGYVLTPLVKQQIPVLAKQFNISEQQVIEQYFLARTLDKQFTTLEEIAKTIEFLVSMDSLALTGQSITIGHGFGI